MHDRPDSSHAAVEHETDQRHSSKGTLRLSRLGPYSQSIRDAQDPRADNRTGTPFGFAIVAMPMRCLSPLGPCIYRASVRSVIVKDAAEVMPNPEVWIVACAWLYKEGMCTVDMFR